MAHHHKSTSMAVIILILLATPSFSQIRKSIPKSIPKNRLVFFAFDLTNDINSLRVDYLQQELPEAIANELSECKGIKILARPDEKKIREEFKVQSFYEFRFEPETKLRLGKTLGANLALVGKINIRVNGCVISSKIVDIETIGQDAFADKEVQIQKMRDLSPGDVKEIARHLAKEMLHDLNLCQNGSPRFLFSPVILSAYFIGETWTEIQPSMRYRIEKATSVGGTFTTWRDKKMEFEIGGTWIIPDSPPVTNVNGQDYELSLEGYSINGVLLYRPSLTPRIMLGVEGWYVWYEVSSRAEIFDGSVKSQDSKRFFVLINVRCPIASHILVSGGLGFFSDKLSSPSTGFLLKLGINAEIPISL